MILWPTVQARLIAALPAVVAPARVYDGSATAKDAPSSWVTVGWQPTNRDDPSAGSFEQGVGPDGFSAVEEGSILLEVAAVTGLTEMPDAFAIAGLISAWVQADMTLGVLAANATASVSAEVLEAQTAAGATQRLLVTLVYTSPV